MYPPENGYLKVKGRMLRSCNDFLSKGMRLFLAYSLGLTCDCNYVFQSLDCLNIFGEKNLLNFSLEI